MDKRINKWHVDDYALKFLGKGIFPIVEHVVYNSALHYMCDITGKSLMDVACGEGDFCRLVKSKGAKEVLGVDISKGLLHCAKERGGDCEYQLGDAYNLGQIGQFDYVTAHRLITYAETYEDLKAMCKSFYDNLKPGGRFIGVGVNCLVEPDWGETLSCYGMSVLRAISPTEEPKRLQVVGNDLKNGDNFEAVIFCFEPEVYEKAFKEVGFKSFNFMPTVIEQNTMCPDGFWKTFLKKPHLLCYVAEK